MRLIANKSLLLMGVLSFMTLAKVEAAVSSDCKIVGIIGTHTVVRLEKGSVNASIDEVLIGTQGHDEQHIDTMQFGLFDNSIETIQVLTITAPYYDHDRNFLLKHQSLGHKYLMLKILENTDIYGNKAPQAINVKEGQILRVTNHTIIEDEIHVLTLLLRDYAGDYNGVAPNGNAADGGCYSTTIHLNFFPQN